TNTSSNNPHICSNKIPRHSLPRKPLQSNPAFIPLNKFTKPPFPARLSNQKQKPKQNFFAWVRTIILFRFRIILVRLTLLHLLYRWRRLCTLVRRYRSVD